MRSKIADVDPFEGLCVSGFKYDLGCYPSFERLDPTTCTKTPSVAWLQAGEVVLGSRRRKVVSSLGREGEKRACDDGAHRVKAVILRVGFAAAGAGESGQGSGATGFELAAENV